MADRSGNDGATLEPTLYGLRYHRQSTYQTSSARDRQALGTLKRSALGTFKSSTSSKEAGQLTLGHNAITLNSKHIFSGRELVEVTIVCFTSREVVKHHLHARAGERTAWRGGRYFLKADSLPL